MESQLFGSVVEWNVPHTYKGYSGKASKYGTLHKIFDKLKVSTGEDDKGWVRVSFNNIDDAKRAQTAISQYCVRKHPKSPWRHQSSVSEDDGVIFLYLRKVNV